jgi:hypothetical protein
MSSCCARDLPDKYGGGAPLKKPTDPGVPYK